MEKKIVEFTNLLRKAGVRVSVAESLDAFTAIDEMPLEDRELFKDALRATMVKRGDDIDTYDRLFDLFWSGFHDQLQSELKQALGGMPGDFDLERLLEQLREMLENMDIDLSELAKALLSMDANALEQLIQQAGEQSEVQNIRNMLQIGFFSRRMIEQMDMEGAGGELKSLIERLREEGMDEARLGELEALLKAVQEAARRAVRQFAERELDKQNHDYIERFRRESLLEKSFYNLTEDDLRRLREVVQRLAQKLKSVITMRRKRERRGKFDLKTTMRRNMAHGGVPFELVFKQRKKEKPKLVVLCDISSSVANVSRFFLQFIFSLQDCFTKVRSFVFVAELGEVSQLFRDHDIFDAIDLALDGGEVINPYTRSNFGMAFHTFWRDFLSAIDNRTTVVVIGDARNNYNDPRAWCLREVHSKAKNVIWINPEAPGAWGFGDSVMDKYLPYTDVAEECRNLKQLTRLVDKLVL
ncbi:MAG: VWA domain-containing protein [Deltaproteobacteria bacterium]|nr:VWA domain-containing protein [Deltaproteobacteria bacterium]